MKSFFLHFHRNTVKLEWSLISLLKKFASVSKGESALFLDSGVAIKINSGLTQKEVSKNLPQFW